MIMKNFKKLSMYDENIETTASNSTELLLGLGVVRRSAILSVDTFSKQSTYSVPIWVYEVVEGDILPIKFEYKERCYKGLRFSERKQRVTFD